MTQCNWLSQKVQFHASLSKVNVWSHDTCGFWSTVYKTLSTSSKHTLSHAATHTHTRKFNLKAQWYWSDLDMDGQKCLLESPDLMSTVALISIGGCGHWDREEDVILLNPVLVNNSCSAERNSTLKWHNYDYHGLAKMQHATSSLEKMMPERIRDGQWITETQKHRKKNRRRNSCIDLVEINKVCETVQFRKHDSWAASFIVTQHWKRTWMAGQAGTCDSGLPVTTIYI